MKKQFLVASIWDIPLRFLTITLLLLPLSLSSTANAFDCTKAQKAAEKTICALPALKKMDRQLNIYYKMSLSSLSPEKQGKFRSSQLKWLKARNRCQDDAVCIQKNYQNWFSEFRKYKAMIMKK